MVAVPFPSLSSPGKFAESGGRLINAYLEKLDDGRIARRRVPGLKTFGIALANAGCRGFLFVSNQLLVAMKDRLYSVQLSGATVTTTDLGVLGGTGTVFFARNNKLPTPDIVAVTEGTAYVISLSTGASAYPDVDVGSPNSVISQGGYFIFTYGDGRMRHTALNDTAINTLDSAFAESRPDGLLRVVNYRDDILAMGTTSTEIWRNTANATGFVYSKVDTIEVGLATADAVSGHEPGFSDYGPRWLGDDGVVYTLDGYQKRRISTHAIEREIVAVVDKTKFEALSYIHNGHPCWALSCDEWTWEHDITTGVWYERQSHQTARWRVRATCRAFNRWIAGDATTGQLYEIDALTKTEGASPLVATIISATMSPFPTRARWKQLDLDIMAGVGLATGADPITTAPRVAVSWSLDGGVAFGNPLQREIGRQGKYTEEIKINNLGIASNRGVQARIDISDPVDFTLFGGDAAFERLAS
jgi:hypothetical protein